jgi:hypothetical protein
VRSHSATDCQAIPRFLDRIGLDADVRSIYDSRNAMMRDW